MEKTSGYERLKIGIIAFRWVADRKYIGIGLNEKSASEDLDRTMALHTDLRQHIRKRNHLVSVEER